MAINQDLTQISRLCFGGKKITDRKQKVLKKQKTIFSKV